MFNPHLEILYCKYSVLWAEFLVKDNGLAYHTYMNDLRNLLDEFKGKPHEEIVAKLDKRGVDLEVAIENTLRDYNMGTIVRNANAFGVRTLHVIGRKQWNKRGAMMTDKYLHMKYYASVDEFMTMTRKRGLKVIAIDNNCESSSILEVGLPEKVVLVFGQEGPGISEELRNAIGSVVHIPQLGSTRSINVGVASGIAMYEWARQHKDFYNANT